MKKAEQAPPEDKTEKGEPLARWGFPHKRVVFCVRVNMPLRPYLNLKHP